MAQPPVENRFTNETGQITSNPGMAQQPIQNRFTDETGQVTSIPGSPATLRDDHVPPSDRRSSSPHDNVSATLLASSSGAVEQDNVSEDSDSDWEAAQDFLRGIPFGPYAWRSLDRHEEMITCESDHVNMRYSIDEIMEVYKAIQAKLREQGGAPQDSSDLEEAVDRVDEEIRAAGGFRHWCEPDKLKKTAVNELSKEFTNAFFTKQLRRRDGAKGGIPNTPPGTPPNNERNVDDNPNAANPSPLPWGLRFWNSPADPVKECFKCLLEEHHILVYIEIYKAIHKRRRSEQVSGRVWGGSNSPVYFHSPGCR